MKDSLDILCTNYEVKEESYNEIETVYHDSLNILRTDVICHHGILGMKWGIRRYQNKDGSLTAAGKKRYYYNPDVKGKFGTYLTKKGEKAFKDRKGNWKTNAAGQAAKARHEENLRIEAESQRREKVATEYVEKQLSKDISKVANMSSPSEYGTNPKATQEWDDIASFGLRTMALSDDDWNSMLDTQSKSDKMWFCCEDQTEGKAEIAAMIKKGYTADEVSKVLDKIQDAPEYGVESGSNFGNSLVFGAHEGSDLKEFAQACENVNYLDNNKDYKLKEDSFKWGGETIKYYEYKKETPTYNIKVDDSSLKYNNIKSFDENFKKNSATILKQCEDSIYNEYKHWFVDENEKQIPKETITNNLRKEKPNVHTNGEIWYWSPDAQHYCVADYDYKNKKVRGVSLEG